MDLKAKIKEYLPYVIIIIVIVLIRSFIVTLVRVDGNSMVDTLHNGEILVLNKLDKDYKRFDIVVIKHNNERLVKRVIGLPGEQVRYKNNTLYINGKKVEEKFIKETTENFNITELGYNKIPKGYYFVVGDNRDNSLDSRYIGLIKKEQIKGTTNIRLFPFNKIGKVNK